MRPSELHPTAKAPRGKGQIREGLRYIKQRPDLMIFMVLVSLVATLTMNFQITNALMATAVFGKGPGEYGLLGTVMAVGTLSATLLAARRKSVRMAYIVAAALATGVFTIIAAFAPSFWLFALALIPIRLSAMTFLNVCNTTVQLTTDPAFRGRVLAVYMAVMQGGTPIGAPLVGWVGTLLGPRYSLIVGGVAALLAGIVALIDFAQAQSHIVAGTVGFGHAEPQVE